MTFRLSYVSSAVVLALLCTMMGCAEKADQKVASSSATNRQFRASPFESSPSNVEQDSTLGLEAQTPTPKDGAAATDASENGLDAPDGNHGKEDPDTKKELPNLEEVLNNPRDEKADSPLGGGRETSEVEVQTIDIPVSWQRLSEQQEVWVDLQNKQVIVAGHICMRAGALEVFACPRRTKEHEAIVSVNASSRQVHGALLAVGANPGHPVRWEENNYTAAEGPVIKITVRWKEDGDVKNRPAQELVKNITTDEIMKLDWVFAGSETYTDPETGEVYYFGDSGEMVCLSNFSTATMDVPVKSAESNAGLLFGANTENIPELGTKVYLVMKPVLEKMAPDNREKKAESGAEKASSLNDNVGRTKDDEADKQRH